MSLSKPPPDQFQFDHNTNSAKSSRKRLKKLFDDEFSDINVNSYSDIKSDQIFIALFYIHLAKPKVTLEQFIDKAVPRGGLSKTNFSNYVKDNLSVIKKLVSFLQNLRDKSATLVEKLRCVLKTGIVSNLFLKLKSRLI